MKITEIETVKRLADELDDARSLRRIAEVGNVVLQLRGTGAAISVSGPAILPLIDAVIVDRIKRLADLGVVVDGGVGLFASPGSRGGGGGGIVPDDGPTGSGSADLDRISAELDEPTGFAALVADVDRRRTAVTIGLIAMAMLGVAVLAAIGLARVHGVLPS